MRIEQTGESRARRRCRSSSLTPDNPATKYTHLECSPLFSPTISVDAARKSKNERRASNRASSPRLGKHLYKLRVCSAGNCINYSVCSLPSSPIDHRARRNWQSGDGENCRDIPAQYIPAAAGFPSSRTRRSRVRALNTILIYL